MEAGESRRQDGLFPFFPPFDFCSSGASRRERPRGRRLDLFKLRDVCPYRRNSVIRELRLMSETGGLEDADAVGG